jgi:putative RNA 2'-phosphotransferase
VAEPGGRQQRASRTVSGVPGRPANRAVRVSKFLALHLRHAPERIGLELAPGGWVDVDALLRAAAAAGFAITRAELDVAVAEPSKRRYAYDEAGTRIRAVQGHSVAVELGYAPSEPPAELFHGTHPGAVDAILVEGLKPMRRRHVHLSSDIETARVVGARRGKPLILRVDAAGMAAAGEAFFRAGNGVWLVSAVPPERLTRLGRHGPPGRPSRRPARPTRA